MRQVLEELVRLEATAVGRMKRLVDARRVLAGHVVEEVLAAGVPDGPFRHVVHLSVDCYPAVVGLAVLVQLLECDERDRLHARRTELFHFARRHRSLRRLPPASRGPVRAGSLTTGDRRPENPSGMQPIPSLRGWIRSGHTPRHGARPHKVAAADGDRTRRISPLQTAGGTRSLSSLAHVCVGVSALDAALTRRSRMRSRSFGGTFCGGWTFSRVFVRGPCGLDTCTTPVRTYILGTRASTFLFGHIQQLFVWSEFLSTQNGQLPLAEDTHQEDVT